MEQKIFYFDVETTGLNSYKNDIIQLAGIIEVNGEIKEQFNMKIKPINWDDISPEAMEVHGMSIEDLKSDEFMNPKDAYIQLQSILSKYVNKFNKFDKFQVAGFNVQFDIGFLRSFFSKNNDNYYGSWFHPYPIDPFAIIPAFFNMDLPNYKLETICNHLGIKIDAHDALSDILATRELVMYVKDRVK